MKRREFLTGISVGVVAALVVGVHVPDDAPYEFDIREGQESHPPEFLHRVEARLDGKKIRRCVAADPKTGRAVIIGTGPVYADPPRYAWRRDIVYTAERGHVEVRLVTT